MSEGFLDSGWKGYRGAGMAGSAGVDVLDVDETGIPLQRGEDLRDVARRRTGSFGTRNVGTRSFGTRSFGPGSW